jgi:hypothetical protein
MFVIFRFDYSPPSSRHLDPFSTLLQSHFTTQQATMSSWTGADDDNSIGPALWSQQDPEFNTNFPVLDKRDFKSMHDVRK